MSNTAERNFSFHTVSDDDMATMSDLRVIFKGLAESITADVPESRERSLAMTKLEESMFWVNAAIARAGK